MKHRCYATYTAMDDGVHVKCLACQFDWISKENPFDPDVGEIAGISNQHERASNSDA